MIGRNFVVRFRGDAALAARRVNKVMDTMRAASSWKEFEVSGLDSSKIQTYFNRDKNQKQVKEETIRKRVHSDVVAPLRDGPHSEASVHLKRREATVYMGWEAAARVVAHRLRRYVRQYVLGPDVGDVRHR